MAQSKLILYALATILCVLSVNAQNPCQSATGMTGVNATQFVGEWFEEMRAPAKNVSCVRLHIGLANNQTALRVLTSYSATQLGLHMDHNANATVNISDVNANTGFNVINNIANVTVNTTYKILSTDYTTNAVLCGFTNSSDTTTSFGIILTRQQIANYTWLDNLKQNASSILTNFADNTAVNITQSRSCYASSAATSVPILATVFAVFYALLKFVY